MGSGSSHEFNSDIFTKGDINIYICGDINPNSGKSEEIANYKILKKIFSKFEGNGKIKDKNNINHIYQYEHRKLDKNIDNSQIKRKNYNAFLFFNKVDETFSKILIEEHLYNMDRKNENKNIIIYFGQNKCIKESFINLYEKSKETIPFLILVTYVQNYSEKLEYINCIPNLKAILYLLLDGTEKYKDEELKSLCKEALFNIIITKIYRMDMYYNQLGYNLNMLNPLNEENCKIKVNLTIGLVGYSGCVKSTLINLLFNDLVCRVSSSATDVTTKCSEYYLPAIVDSDNLGQIRFLDFPGIANEKNYYDIIKPEIEKKIKEYKDNREQIDLILFYIPNSISKELNNTSIEFINFIHSKNIKILFIINGEIKPFLLNDKKIKLKNGINNNEIVKDDFSNIINTDYYQYYNKKNTTGISLILEKIIDTIKIKDKNFHVEDITVDNYKEKLKELQKLSRFFELYENMSDFRDSIRIKSNLVVFGFSALSLGTSAISILVPFVDTFTSIGYQVAMVYSILSLYGLDSREYNITNIILSGGNTIELEDKYKIKNGEKADNNSNKDNEVLKGNIREGLSNFGKAAIFFGKSRLQDFTINQGGKVIAQQAITTVARAEAIKVISREGAQTTIEYGTKGYIITVTKNIVFQGEKASFVNLGKAIPFIGVGINAFINTFATAKIGHKLVTKLDEEFEYNKQRKVDIIKGKVLGIYNIIDQLKYLIQLNNN